MANILLYVDYNTSQHSRQFDSYRVRMLDTQEAASPLREWDFYNNVVTYRGVFPSKAEAAKAVLGYVTASFILVERDDPTSGKTVNLQEAGSKPWRENGVSVRVLARRDSRGEFVASH